MTRRPDLGYGRGMSTRVYFVRHGSTPLTAEDRFAGSTDLELSDEGRSQVSQLAERLQSERIAQIYASPMRRTMETARILGAPQKLAPLPREGLREIDHGRWEGLSRKEVAERFPSEYEAWEKDPFTFAPQGGEAGVAVMARALPIVRAVVEAHPGETVVVVSHKATIRLVISSLLGIDARGYRDRLDQSPACLNALEFKDAVRARLVLYNDISHYADAHRATGPRLSSWFDPK